MGQAATADVVVRSRKKGAKVYRDVQDQLTKLASKAKLFGLASGAVAIGGLTALTVKSFASADALAKQAEKIGISTQRLGALNHLAVQAGGSVGGMQEALVKATKRLGEFNTTGGGAAAVWLKRLNLDSKELATLKPDELFGRYADSIGGLNSRGEKLAAISALMGDESRALIGLIDQGSSAFDAAEAEVVRYGIALNGVDSAKIEAANDAIFKVKERFTGIGNVIASKVAPVITAIANRFLDSGTEADVMGNIVDKVMDGIAVGAGIVADALFGLKILFAGIRFVSLEFSASFVGSLAAIEKATIIVGNKMRETFGGDLVIDPASGFLSRVEESLRASSEHAANVLAGLAASERPSIALGRALAQVRVDAEGTAQATAKAREKLQDISAPTFEESSKEEAASARAEQAKEKLREQLAGRLETIEASLRTETEAELVAFKARQEIIDQALESGLISRERALEDAAKLQLDHQEKLAKIVTSDENLREKLAGRLETIEAALLTETESELFAFEQRQEIIDNALEVGLISRARALEIAEKLQLDHEEKLTKIANKGLSDRQKFELLASKEKVKNALSTLSDITSGVATSNKTLFRINQAAAIATAIIKTHEGVMHTLGAYPWPLAGILAAVHATAGAAQIAAIRSASPGGGTTPSLAGSTQSFNDQPVSSFDPTQAATGGADNIGSRVTIIVEGSLIGDQAIKEVLAGTINELVDADQIIIDPKSRNAEEIRRGTGSGG